MQDNEYMEDMYKEEHTEKKPKGRGLAFGYITGIITGLVICSIAVTVMRFGDELKLKAAGITPETVYENGKVEAIHNMMKEHYLEEIDDSVLADSMLKGLVNGLGDKYAAYYSPEEFREIKESATGDYNGIGMVMSKLETGEVLIIGCYEGTPAEAAGIKSGDYLIRVDDMDAVETDLNVVVAYIKNGETDTSVHLVWSHEGEELEADIVRSSIEVPVLGYEMLEDQVGYIQLVQFTGVATQQFAEALADLKGQGMKALVVDLRDNPGGLLDSAVAILEQILPEGLIVYTEDKNKNRTEYTGEGKTPIDVPLYVLVNEHSASASEIFAGAVKDYGVGTLIGSTTFGKGIVQQTLSLTDGSAVKMTIAYYYTPKGNCIHGTGIEPDVAVEEMPYEEGKEDEWEDLPLKKALELCK